MRTKNIKRPHVIGAGILAIAIMAAGILLNAASFSHTASAAYTKLSDGGIKLFYQYSGGYYATYSCGNDAEAWCARQVICPSGATPQSYSNKGEQVCRTASGDDVDPIRVSPLQKVYVVDTGESYYYAYDRSRHGPGAGQGDGWVTCSTTPTFQAGAESSYEEVNFINNWRCDGPVSESSPPPSNVFTGTFGLSQSTLYMDTWNQFLMKSVNAPINVGTVCVHTKTDQIYYSSTGTCPAESEFPVKEYTYTFDPSDFTFNAIEYGKSDTFHFILRQTNPKGTGTDTVWVSMMSPSANPQCSLQVTNPVTMTGYYDPSNNNGTSTATFDVTCFPQEDDLGGPYTYTLNVSSEENGNNGLENTFQDTFHYSVIAPVQTTQSTETENSTNTDTAGSTTTTENDSPATDTDSSTNTTVGENSTDNTTATTATTQDSATSSPTNQGTTNTTSSGTQTTNNDPTNTSPSTTTTTTTPASGSQTSQFCETGEKCPEQWWCGPQAASDGTYVPTDRCYYSDGDIQCVDFETKCSALGLTSCRPGEINCIEPGATGSGNEKWCARGMKFYKIDSVAEEFICSQDTSMDVSPQAPAGYTSCYPGDEFCKEKGESWSGSEGGSTQFYCSNGKQCTTIDGGGLCVGWNETCPAGTTLCPAGDPNCIEPGEKKVANSENYYWCPDGMMFYSQTEVFCPQIESTPGSMMMFTHSDVKEILADLGNGWGLCRPGDEYCLEPGETGSSGSWCAWMPPTHSFFDPNTSSVTCPSLEEGTVVQTSQTTVTPEKEGEKLDIKTLEFDEKEDFGIKQATRSLINDLSRCEERLQKLEIYAKGSAKQLLASRIQSVRLLKESPFQGATKVDVDTLDQALDQYHSFCFEGIDLVQDAVRKEQTRKGVCGELKSTKTEIKTFLADPEAAGFSEDVLERAKKSAPEALEVIDNALEENDAQVCKDAMLTLQRINRKTFGSKVGEEFERGLFQVDRGKLLQSQIGKAFTDEQMDEIAKRIEEKFLQKFASVEKQLEILTNQIANEFMTKIASLEEKLSTLDRVQQVTTKVVEVTASLPEAVRNIAFERRDELATVVTDVSESVPDRFQNEFDMLAGEVFRYNWSSEALTTLKRELDGLTDLLEDEDTTRLEMNTAFRDLREVIEQLRESDIERQWQEGMIPFLDTYDPVDHFEFSHVVKLHELGILRGEDNKGEIVNRARNINLAESGALFVRGLHLGDVLTAEPNRLRAQVPDWARPEMSILAGANIELVTNPDRDFGLDASRGELFRIAVGALHAAGVTLPEVSCTDAQLFPDLSCENPAATAALQLHAMGIVNGFAEDGTIRLDAPLNRAQAATVVGRLLETPEVTSVVPIPVE